VPFSKCAMLDFYWICDDRVVTAKKCVREFYSDTEISDSIVDNVHAGMVHALRRLANHPRHESRTLFARHLREKIIYFVGDGIVVTDCLPLLTSWK
jgi:hypothetical protein